MADIIKKAKLVDVTIRVLVDVPIRDIKRLRECVYGYRMGDGATRYAIGHIIAVRRAK